MSVTAPIPEPAENEFAVETIGDLELFPDMLARLFSGQNTGKLVLELPSTGGQP